MSVRGERSQQLPVSEAVIRQAELLNGIQAQGLPNTASYHFSDKNPINYSQHHFWSYGKH